MLSQSINGWHIYSGGKRFLVFLLKILFARFSNLSFFQREWTSTMSKKIVRKITIGDQKKFNGISLSNFKAHELPGRIGIILPPDEMGYVNACIDEVPGDFGRNGVPVGRTYMVGHGETVHSLPPCDRRFVWTASPQDRYAVPTECLGSMQESQ